MSLFTAQLHPGRALGFLVLGASLHDILTRLKAEPQRFPKLDLSYSPADPVRDPVILGLPANGLRLRFDGPEQRLRLIEILDFSKNHVFFREQNKDRDLVKPPSSTDDAAWTTTPANRTTGVNGNTTTPVGPTFRHIYSRFLGPTYGGEFVPGEGGAESMGTYVLSYPGVAFTFPMAASAYAPGKDVVSLLSAPGMSPATSMAVFSGDSWAQARDHLWTEPLPAVKTFAPLARGKDSSPNEVALVRIHGGGKLQLVRRWPGETSAEPAATTTASSTTTTPAHASDASSSPSSWWLHLGETTPQQLVAELGPPDAIYRKNDQRMYIHKMRTTSSSRPRPTNGASVDPLHYHHDPLTDTDQSSVPTQSSDDDPDDEEAIEDEFLSGNVSGECFFNYFYLGFDVLVSTPTPPSRPPGVGTAQATGPPPEATTPLAPLAPPTPPTPPTPPLRSEAADRLVATKLVLHGNVPGSYPFNRHRRCRWEIAYLADRRAAVHAETPFAQIEAHLHREWRGLYGSDEEARQRQRGMVLNRGWGDSPGSSIELLGGWEEGQRGGRGGGGGVGGGVGGAGGKAERDGRGDGRGDDATTTTLYGFPGLVFEVLRNGYVSALTVF